MGLARRRPSSRYQAAAAELLLLPLLLWGSFCGAQQGAGLCNDVMTVGDGTIIGHANAGPCGWRVLPTDKQEVSSIRLTLGHCRLAAGDELALYSVTSERLARFSASEPFPDQGLTVKDLSEVFIFLRAASNDTWVELHIEIKPRGFLESLLPLPLVMVAACFSVAVASTCFMAWVGCICHTIFDWDRFFDDMPYPLAGPADRDRPPTTAEAEQRVARALELLPTVRCSRSEGGECCFCLDEFKEGDDLRILPCEHRFHKDCVDRWFASRRFSLRCCPLCKRNPVPGACSARVVPEEDTAADMPPRQRTMSSREAWGSVAGEEVQVMGLPMRVRVGGQLFAVVPVRQSPGEHRGEDDLRADDMW